MVMASKSVTNGGHHPVSHTARYPHSTTEAGMTRTFNPKYASYMGDGSGRDSYVVVNNGGLTGDEKRYMMWRPNKLKHEVNPRPFKPAPSHAYRSDGSGRDSYVIQNSGGLVADYRSSSQHNHFMTGLRQHNVSPLRNSNDRSRGPDITDFLNCRTPQEQFKQRIAAQKQREAVRRLSPPRINLKYADFNEVASQTLTAEKMGQMGRQNRALSHIDKVRLQHQILTGNRIKERKASNGFPQEVVEMGRTYASAFNRRKESSGAVSRQSNDYDCLPNAANATLKIRAGANTLMQDFKTQKQIEMERRSNTNPSSPQGTPMRRMTQTSHADTRINKNFPNEMKSTGTGKRFRPLAVPGALQVQQVGLAEVATIHKD